MASKGDLVAAIQSAADINERVRLIRRVPELYGKSLHTKVYASIAKTVYAKDLAPDFAFVHWRDEYELAETKSAYEFAFHSTEAFARIKPDDIARAILEAPTSLRIFRLLLGLTTQEFSAATLIVASRTGRGQVLNGTIKNVESGKAVTPELAAILGQVIDEAMRGVLFGAPPPGLRGKISKPDTANGWDSVRTYAQEGVPLPVFLHQRHYGGAFRQLLDSTSSLRGNVLEQAVESLFNSNGIQFIRTGSDNQAAIARDFGLTLKPAPDFVVHDRNSHTLRALLECKQVNDGGTARDKAARFTALGNEASRLGGIPVFAVLAGLGWSRTMDALGPVVRDTDGRVFTLASLDSMMTVDPFPGLKRD